MIHIFQVLLSDMAFGITINPFSRMLKGHVAALVRSHMNGTIEQTTETMPLALKQLIQWYNDKTLTAYESCQHF